VKSEVLMMVIMKSIIFQNVKLYNLIEVYQCFRKTYCRPLHGQRVCWASKQAAASSLLLASLTIWAWRQRQSVNSKHWRTSTTLYIVIFQEIYVLFTENVSGKCCACLPFEYNFPLILTAKIKSEIKSADIHVILF
jgi:hypothetical protein